MAQIGGKRKDTSTMVRAAKAKAEAKAVKAAATKAAPAEAAEPAEK